MSEHQWLVAMLVAGAVMLGLAWAHDRRRLSYLAAPIAVAGVAFIACFVMVGVR